MLSFLQPVSRGKIGIPARRTATVPGHREQVLIDFRADNPGQRLFHCGDLYHLDAGMARVVKYVE